MPVKCWENYPRLITQSLIIVEDLKYINRLLFVPQHLQVVRCPDRHPGDPEFARGRVDTLATTRNLTDVDGDSPGRITYGRLSITKLQVVILDNVSNPLALLGLCEASSNPNPLLISR